MRTSSYPYAGYGYTTDLVKLEARKPVLKADEWAALLRDHPDKDLVDYLIRRITFRF